MTRAAPHPTHRRRSRRLLLATVAAMVVLVQATDAGAQDCADDSPAPTGTSEQVDFTGIVPGATREWFISVHNEWDVAATVQAELSSTGSLGAALVIDVRGCDDEWLAGPPPVCAPGARQLLAPATLGGGVELPPASLEPDAWWWVVVRAHLPASAGNEFQGAVGAIRTIAVWTQECGPTTTTTPPPSTVPSSSVVPPSAAPATGVPVVATGVDPSPDLPTGDAAAVPVAPTVDRPSPGAPDRLPFSGSTTWSLLLAAAGLTLLGAWCLVVARRDRAIDRGGLGTDRGVRPPT